MEQIDRREPAKDPKRKRPDPVVEWRRPRPSGIWRLLWFNPCFVLAVGVLLAINSLGPSPRPDHAIDPERVALVEGRITASVQSARGYLYTELTPTRVEQSGRTILYPARLALYLRHSSDEPSGLYYGHRVRFISHLKPPNYFALPGVPDYRELLWQRGILHVARLKSMRQLQSLKREHDLGFLGLLFLYRAGFERRLTRLGSGPRRLIHSAFLGDRRLLEEPDRAQIRRLGVLHLFVVSGFHVSLVVIAAHLWLSRFGLTGQLAALALGWAYVFLTGAPVATVRAGLMTTLFFGLRDAGLAPHLLNSLGITTLLLACTWPDSIASPGFHFCFLSLTVIGVMLRPLTRFTAAGRRGLGSAYSSDSGVSTGRLNRLQRRIRFGWEERTEFLPRRMSRVAAWVLTGPFCYLLSLAAGSLLIQLGTLPLSLFYSNLLVPSQVLNNLVLVPAFSLLIGLSLVWFGGFWIPVVGDFLALLTDTWAGFVWSAMQHLDNLTTWIFLPHPGLLEGAVYVAVFFTCWWVLRGWWRLLLLLPAPLLIGLLCLPPKAARRDLVVTFLDVGQADSIHLQYPDGSQALVDCGGLRQARPGNDFVGRALVGRYLWELGQRRLAYILLSHPHDDHIQGLRFLQASFHPSRVYYFQPDRRYAPSSSLVRVQRGRTFLRGGVYHEVLHPPAESGRWSTNNASLVLWVRYGHFSMLLTGDIEREAEAALLGENKIRSVAVLKVAHHGAATSSSIEFLRAAAPRLGVISAGRRNPFGHPSPQTLDRFRQLDIPILTTAGDGTIRVSTDGVDWRISAYEIGRGQFVSRLADSRLDEGRQAGRR